MKINSKCYKVGGGGIQGSETLNVVCFYQSFLFFRFRQHTTILCHESSYKQVSKQPNIHLPLSSYFLLLPMHFSGPHHCQISCAVHLSCLYSPIHSSLLNYYLASNTTKLLKLLVNSM